MKIKQHLVIVNPDHFVRGDYADCFGLWGYDPEIDNWFTVGEVTLEVNVSHAVLGDKILKAIEKELETTRREFTKRMEVLEGRKAQLLAITFDEEKEKGDA